LKNLIAITLLLSLASISFAKDACIMEGFNDEVIDTAKTLKEIEQSELTQGQCKVFRKEFKRRNKNRSPKLTDKEFNRSKVLCGKWMFINLGMKTKIGIPVKLIKAMEKFEGVGPKLNKLGFLTDDSIKERQYPFGIVPSKHHNALTVKKIAVAKVAQISCAACHAGQLPSGEYSLGLTNEKLKYGELNIYTLFSIWMTDASKYDTNRWIPELIEKYKELRDENDSFFISSLITVANLPANKLVIKLLIGEEAPSLETQRSFVNSSPGIFNGFAPSLNFEDRQIYITAPQVFGFGSENESHYGTLASSKTTEEFVGEAFVYTNRSTKYNRPEFTQPIAEYLKCIKAPKNPKKIEKKLYTKGKNLFKNNCTSCHDLNHGGGSMAVPREEINLPTDYIQIFAGYKPVDVQSKATFKVIEKLGMNQSAKDVKVKRLNGLWARKRLTTNGQINGLDHLFCLNKKERTIIDDSSTKTQGIHLDLCDNYTVKEKKALKEFLIHF
jgi:cytochrome c5